VNRSEAATTLFEWQFEGDPALVRAAVGDGRPLVAIVESIADSRPPPRPRPAHPLPPIDFLQLEEERALQALHARVHSLARVLRPEEHAGLEARFRDIMPAGQIAALRTDIERFDGLLLRRTVQTDFEASFAPKEPEGAADLLAVFLFARDGRLLANEGEVASLEVPALSALVSRGESGSTWSLRHRAGVIVGHVGQRAGLVAVFAGRPQPVVGGTLRLSMLSLEQKDRLENALTRPSSHQTLMAYVRAVRALLAKHV